MSLDATRGFIASHHDFDIDEGHIADCRKLAYF